jgi:hypothetical protein
MALFNDWVKLIVLILGHEDTKLMLLPLWNLIIVETPGESQINFHPEN